MLGIWCHFFPLRGGSRSWRGPDRYRWSRRPRHCWETWRPRCGAWRREGSGLVRAANACRSNGASGLWSPNRCPSNPRPRPRHASRRRRRVLRSPQQGRRVTLRGRRGSCRVAPRKPPIPWSNARTTPSAGAAIRERVRCRPMPEPPRLPARPEAPPRSGRRIVAVSHACCNPRASRLLRRRAQSADRRDGGHA